MSRVWVFACAWLCACPAKAPDPLVCDDATWDGFAKPVLTTWCTPCHSATVPLEDRSGAPMGVDFDTWVGANTWADAIARTAGESKTMPPAGGLPEADRERMVRWASCGGTGFDPPLGACAQRVPFEGDLTETTDVCATGANAVTGNVSLSATPVAPLDCLCEVDGDLSASGFDTLSLPQLLRVGGLITLRGEALRDVSLPALVEAGGVSIESVNLEALDLSVLTVTGRIFVSGGRLPTTLALTRLQTVENSLQVLGVRGVLYLDLPRIEAIGGDLVVDGLPQLRQVVHTSDLITVGGALRLVNNPALIGVEDFAFLQYVYGDLEIGGGGDLRGLEAFYSLQGVGGDLTLRDEPRLQNLIGFNELVEVTGAVRVLRTGLVSLDGFDRLDAIGGLEVASNPVWDGGIVGQPSRVVVHGPLRVASNAVMTTLPLVVGTAQVDGAIDVSGNPSLARLTALAALPQTGGSLSITGNASLIDLGAVALTAVGGDLFIENNSVLDTLQGLAAMQSVAGDLRVVDNTGLPQARIDQWLPQVVVGGTVTVTGNGL